VEKDIDILRNEQGGFSVTEDFCEKFYKFIVDHYLPQPGKSGARASGGQVLELEQKNKKKFTWLQKLMPKSHTRRQT